MLLYSVGVPNGFTDGAPSVPSASNGRLPLNEPELKRWRVTASKRVLRRFRRSIRLGFSPRVRGRFSAQAWPLQKIVFRQLFESAGSCCGLLLVVVFVARRPPSDTRTICSMAIGKQPREN